MQKILAGEISRSNILASPQLFDLYITKKKMYDQAFQIFAERKVFLLENVLKSGKQNLKICYIQNKNFECIDGLCEDIYKAKGDLVDYSGEKVVLFEGTCSFSVLGLLSVFDSLFMLNDSRPVPEMIIFSSPLDSSDFFAKLTSSRENKPKACRHFLTILNQFSAYFQSPSDFLENNTLG